MTRPVDTSKDGNIVVARSEDHEIIASRSGSTVRCAASDCKWRGPTYRIWFEISKRRRQSPPSAPPRRPQCRTGRSPNGGMSFREVGQ